MVPLRHALLLTVGLTWALPLVGEERGRPLCGTFPARARLEEAKHRFALQKRGPDSERRLLASRIETIGELVVVTDDGTIVSEANPFDLRGRGVVFSPAGSRGYVSFVDGVPFDPSLGDPVSLGDDDSQSFDLPFPFYGKEHDSLFLNSDGNLTFESPDSESSARCLERMLNGPPRISLFFADLDPSDGGEVRVLATPDRFVVSWQNVAEFDEDSPNTFQVDLHPNGTVAMRYALVVTADSGIVGLSPGDNPEDANLVDLSESGGDSPGAIAESFRRGRTIDNVQLARRFYGELTDRYDALVVWTNFESDLDDAFAFQITTQNDVSGIGDPPFDDSAILGSDGELESFVFMGNVARYPSSPEGRVFGAASRPTTLGLLAHEVGHRWLARARVDLTGVAGDVLLGRQESHWSFFFDSDASFLEGNDIEQEAENRFRTVATVSGYSRLDLYLMGLAPSSEVGPFFVVRDASGSSPTGLEIDSESSPRTDVTITGTRQDVLIDDVLRALGPRSPSVENSPKTFRHAWVLLTRPGEPPRAEEVAKLENARNAFLRFFEVQTLGRGRLSTTLEP